MLTLFSVSLTAFIAVKAFIYTKKEYSLHIEKERSQILSDFNKRYCTDKNIEAVVKYLIDDNPDKIKAPTTYQKELFMRFFEELEYAVMQKALDEEVVFDMFAYYAIKAYDLRDKFIEKTEERYWLRFIEFIKRMKHIAESRKNTN